MAGNEVTRYLERWRQGDPEALEHLTTAMYSELRRIAAAVLHKGSGSPTINPTALVHELYFHLPGLQSKDLPSRADFLNLSARVMRNIVLDLARKASARKRGGPNNAFLPSLQSELNDPGLHIDVLLIHDLLNDFASIYPRQARVVELRFFGGLTEEECCEVLQLDGEDVSPRTLARDWAFAKAWLQKRVTPREQ